MNRRTEGSVDHSPTRDYTADPYYALGYVRKMLANYAERPIRRDSRDVVVIPLEDVKAALQVVDHAGAPGKREA